MSQKVEEKQKNLEIIFCEECKFGDHAKSVKEIIEHAYPKQFLITLNNKGSQAQFDVKTTQPYEPYEKMIWSKKEEKSLIDSKKKIRQLLDDLKDILTSSK